MPQISTRCVQLDTIIYYTGITENKEEMSFADDVQFIFLTT